MRPHRTGLKPLQSGLASVLGKERLERLAPIACIRRRWPELVGPVLAQHSEPLDIERDALIIAVDHPAMAQQIRFLQAEIRRACRRKCRMEGIRYLRTRIQPNAGAAAASPPGEGVVVSLSIRKKLLRELPCIADRKLRRAIFKARLAQYVHRRPPQSGDPRTEKSAGLRTEC